MWRADSVAALSVGNRNFLFWCDEPPCTVPTQDFTLEMYNPGGRVISIYVTVANDPRRGYFHLPCEMLCSHPVHWGAPLVIADPRWTADSKGHSSPWPCWRHSSPSASQSPPFRYSWTLHNRSIVWTPNKFRAVEDTHPIRADVVTLALNRVHVLHHMSHHVQGRVIYTASCKLLLMLPLIRELHKTKW